MDKKDVLNRITKLLKFGVEEEPQIETEFKEEKLIDGTIVRVNSDEFKVGESIYIVTSEGVDDLEGGEYILESGKKLIINSTQDGSYISEIIESESESESEESTVTDTPTEMEEEKEEEMEQEEEKEEEMEEEKEDLINRLIRLEELVDQLIDNQKITAESQIEISEQLEEFSKITPRQGKQQEFKSHYEQIKSQRKTDSQNKLESIRKLRSK